MIKWLSRLIQLSIILSLFGLVAIIGLITLVNPNQFKAGIQKKISHLSQRPTLIKGPIRWRISGGLGLEMEDIVLQDKEDAQQSFLTIKKARFVMYPRDLFSGQFFTLELFNSHLKLIQSDDFDNNWQDILEHAHKKNIVRQIFFNTLKIYGGQLEFQHQPSNKQFNFKNIHLNLGNITRALQNKLTSCTLKFIVQESLYNKMAQCHLKVDWKLMNEFKTLDLQNAKIKFQVENYPTTLLHFQAKIDHFNTDPQMEGNLKLDNLELTAWFRYFNLAYSESLPKNLSLKMNFKFQTPKLEIADFHLNLKPYGHFQGNLIVDSLTQWKALRTLNLKGMISGTDLCFENLKINHFKTAVNMQNKFLDISPLEMRCADSLHQSNLQIDLREDLIKYRLSQESHHFQINSFLGLLGHPNKIEGYGHMKGFFTAEGNSFSDIKSTLNGQLDIEISNGKIFGIDLPSLLKHAQNTVKTLMYADHNKQAVPLSAVLKSELGQWQEQANNADKFSFTFNNAKANFLINAGIVTNQDLFITHPLYTIRGNGSLDFANEDFRLSLDATHKHSNPNTLKEIAHFLSDTPLSINIRGTLKNPSLRPELENYAELALKFSQHNMFENFVDKNLNKLFDVAE